MNEQEIKYLEELRKKAQDGHVPSITEILAHPDVDKPFGYSQETFLHELAERGQAREQALQHPSATTVRDDRGWTPLHVSGQAGFNHPEFATLKDNKGGTPLHWMASRSHLQVLQHPMVAIVKDNDGNTPLHKLASRRKEEVLSHPKANTVTNNEGETPAQVFKETDRVWAQLDAEHNAAGAEYEAEQNFDEADYDPFFFDDDGDYEHGTIYSRIGYIDGKIVNIDMNESDVDDAVRLLSRARQGDKSVLDDPNVASFVEELQFHTTTPLHCLAEKGIIEVLKHPLVAKLSLQDITNSYIETPLQILAGKGVVAVLGHSEVSFVASNKRSALHKLAEAGCKEVLRHADVAKVRDYNDATPLHELARAGIIAVYDHPESRRVVDKGGKTPAEMLEEKGIKQSFVSHIKHAANVIRQEIAD